MSSAKWRPFCLGLNVLTVIAYLSNYSNFLQLWYKTLTVMAQTSCRSDTHLSLYPNKRGGYLSVIIIDLTKIIDFGYDYQTL